jgi:cell division protein FtsW (lipid II flippase)
MEQATWLLAIVAGPCLPVALLGWRRVGRLRLVAALCWTLVAWSMTLLCVGLAVFGDCAEDVIGPVPGNPCHAAKRQAMIAALAIGIAILAFGNWRILRRGRR